MHRALYPEQIQTACLGATTFLITTALYPGQPATAAERWSAGDGCAAPCCEFASMHFSNIDAATFSNSCMQEMCPCLCMSEADHLNIRVHPVLGVEGVIVPSCCT